MGVHVVDPDWIQKTLSLPFFALLTMTLVCSYGVSPYLASRLVPRERYKKLGHKTMSFNSYLSSAIHAVVACMLAGSVLAFGELGKDKIYSVSPGAASTLHATLGYTVADTFICLLDPHLRSTYSTIMHHLAMISGISMGLYHQLFIFFIVYRLLSELSTPFVDLWTVLHEVGDRSGRWYYAASIAMMISFFLCRVLVIPWHNYELLRAIFSSEGLAVPWYLRLYMIINYTAFDAFNLFWFYKILRGGYKLLFLRKRIE